MPRDGAPQGECVGGCWAAVEVAVYESGARSGLPSRRGYLDARTPQVGDVASGLEARGATAQRRIAMPLEPISRSHESGRPGDPDALPMNADATDHSQRCRSLGKGVLTLVTALTFGFVSGRSSTRSSRRTSARSSGRPND